MSTPAPAATCPSCERYIGPLAACPYCDARARPPWPLRVLRGGAWLLATLGLAFLYEASVQRELPLVKAAALTPQMNFASVRVRGTVARDAFVGRRRGQADYLAFTLDDGSGQVRVAAYGPTARQLVADGRVPKRGMRAEAAGSLHTAADGPLQLRLQSPQQLVLR